MDSAEKLRHVANMISNPPTSRAERLREKAQDLTKIWAFAVYETDALAYSLLGEDRFRLSLDEYNEFLREYATYFLGLLKEKIDGLEIKTVSIPDSEMCEVIASTTTFKAPWKQELFPKPAHRDSEYICFATPLAINDHNQKDILGGTGALTDFMRGAALRSKHVTLTCRALLRHEQTVWIAYTVHVGGETTRVIVTSAHTKRWACDYAALVSGAYDTITDSAVTGNRKRVSSTDDHINIWGMPSEEADKFTELCLDKLETSQPQASGHIQAWYRANEFHRLTGTEPARPKDRHGAAVDLYLECSKILFEIAAKKDVDEFYRQAAARIRLATIYEVDASLLRQLLHRSKPLIDSLIEQHSGTEEQRLYEAARRAAPLPEKRPFQDMFIALSRPVLLDCYPETTAKMLTQIRGIPTRQVWCEALLITRDCPFMFHIATPPHRELIGLWTEHWESGYTALPWALPWLVRLLDEHNDKVVPHQTGRVAYQTKAKRLRVAAKTPPPYYAVTLRPHHLSPAKPSGMHGSTGVEREWTHRWHVQGHERVLVRRGPLPLELTERERLLKRGYQVFERDLDDRARTMLRVRSHSPKRYDEWLAVKYVRVSEAIKPDRPDLPLVPSTRRVTGLTT